MVIMQPFYVANGSDAWEYYLLSEGEILRLCVAFQQSLSQGFLL